MKSIRWHSLKFRYALIFTVFIAAILLFNAGLLIYLKYTELRNSVNHRALSFAKLAVKPVCDGYETYFYSGYFKFRELLGNLMSSQPDLRQIQIVDVNGNMLFNSDDLQKSHFIPHIDTRHPVVSDAYYLDAVRKLEMSQRQVVGSDGSTELEIISPYIEEWGRHKLSVILTFSYAAVRPQIQLLIYQVAGLTLLSMLFTSFLAWVFTGKITEPLDRLTDKARRMIHEGVEEKEMAGSENEVDVLTRTFTSMTSKIEANITQLEENNLRLEALNEELKELDRLKSDLLANVSHELRTPLTSIKGYTEYILEGKLGAVTPKQKKGLMVVQRNLERLSKLISALLDFSLMDADRMPLSVQPFSIKTLCKQIAANLGSELEKRSLRFHLNIPDDLPPAIGDREKIYQVLENLTINAVKFTENGGKISIRARELYEKNQLFVRIWISDTGVGIPSPALDRIFDRFYQVDASSKRKYGGMGLGLAIAKSIIDAHNGRIEVESEIGKGTTFVLTLHAMAATQQQTDNIPLRKESGEKYAVQIIDDDPEVLDF